MATTVNMTTFWHVAPCSLVEVDWRFRAIMEAIRTSVSRPHGAVSQKAVIFILTAVRIWVKATTVFAETLDNFQHSTRLISIKRKLFFIYFFIIITYSWYSHLVCCSRNRIVTNVCCHIFCFL
jgi:hypothetical protein